MRPTLLGGGGFRVPPVHRALAIAPGERTTLILDVRRRPPRARHRRGGRVGSVTVARRLLERYEKNHPQPGYLSGKAG
jgi:hypothetical protein